MGRVHRMAGFFAAAILFLPCLLASSGEGDLEIIKSTGQKILKIYQVDDPGPIFDEYMSPKSLFMPPGKPAVMGKAGFLKMIAGMDINLKLMSDRVEIYDNIAVQTHHFQMKERSNAVLRNGKGIRVWKKISKKTWILLYSVWNYNN